jgi:hypothetical protein
MSSISQFFDTLGTDALNAVSSFAEGVENEAKTIWTNVEPTIAADLKTVASQLMPVALNLVAGFATAAFNQWTGGQKAAAVDVALVANAKAQGLNLLMQDAGMIRQLAYRSVGMAAPKANPTAGA